MNPGAYTPAPDSESFQWLVNGKPVAGATGTTYTPTAKDAKQLISVAVTVTKATYSDLVAKSAAVGPVDFADLTVTGAPVISGKAQVGETLTAEQGTVRFNQSVDSQHYEWFRDGQIIPGADQVTYVLTGDDVGKRITARIIGFKEGHSARERRLGRADRQHARRRRSDVRHLCGHRTGGQGAQPARRLHQRAPGQQHPGHPVGEEAAPAEAGRPHRRPQHRKLKGKKIRYGTVAEVSLWHVFEYHPSNPKVTWFVKKKGTKKVRSSRTRA